jgi:flagellum-specific peptidoglycan hydrolase FlgJ
VHHVAVHHAANGSRAAAGHSRSAEHHAAPIPGLPATGITSAVLYRRHDPGSAAAPGSGTPSEQHFIAAVAPGAIAAQRRYGVPAAVTIAQAIDESGWGQSTLASADNNLFGIKGSGPAGSVFLPTQEYENGQFVTLTMPFRVYQNVAQSIEDHGKLLATSQYYQQAMAERHDPNAFAAALTGIYATDPQYGTKLIALMRRYDLYRYDGMAPSAAPHGAAPGRTAHTAAPSPAPDRASPSSGPDAKSPQRGAHKAAPTPTRRSVAPAAAPGGAASGPVVHPTTPHPTPHDAPIPGLPSDPPGQAHAGAGTAWGQGRSAGRARAPGPGQAVRGGGTRNAGAGANQGPAPSAGAGKGRRGGATGGARAGLPPAGPAAAQAGPTHGHLDAAQAVSSAATMAFVAVPAAMNRQTQRTGSRGARSTAARYQPQMPPSVTTALITNAKLPLLREEPLYRDIAKLSGIRWELLAACDWMQCRARSRYSPARGEKLGTVNPDGTIYRTRSEALEQCSYDLVELAGGVYQIDATSTGGLSVGDLASVFAAFRWGGLLQLHHTSAMEFPYSVAGLTVQHLNMRWPKIADPNTPDKPGGRFRKPFGAVPIVLALNYHATV